MLQASVKLDKSCIKVLIYNIKFYFNFFLSREKAKNAAGVTIDIDENVDHLF